MTTALAPEEIDRKRKSLEAQLATSKRLIKVKMARDSLIEFVKFTTPDIDEPENTDKSAYDPQLIHIKLAELLEKVEQGKITRLIVTTPPGIGKSQLVSRRFPAWVVGKHPTWETMLATYNESFAESFGGNVRDLVRGNNYKQVFPGVQLKPGSQSKEKIENTNGGSWVFIGCGGSATGRRCDLGLIDDPVKDREEADSPAMREKAWQWFTQVFMTRMRDFRSRVVVVMTRWSEDDIVGRLIDPQNDHYNKEEAAQWTVFEFPAIAREDDALGRKKGEALWPERFPLDYLEGIRRRDPRGFSALFQCRPTPEEGNFFKAEMLKTYKAGELPKDLRYYAASDHAVSTVQAADKTCMGVVGVDCDDNIWVLPDLVWRRMPADATVDAMIDLIKRYKPLFWWAESGQISKSIGPFLRKRMIEEKAYCSIIEVSCSKDKRTRAQAIHGRMAMGKVFFPDLPGGWWSEAKEELLKFPAGRHDDFCLSSNTFVLTSFGWKAISKIQVGEMVQTRSGPRRVTWSGQTGVANVVTRLGITATPEHPVWTENRGWVPIVSLTHMDVVACVGSPCDLMGTSITGTRIQNIGLSDHISILITNMGLLLMRFTGMFLKPLMEGLGLVYMCITRKVQTTTGSLNLSPALRLNMGGITEPQRTLNLYINENGREITDYQRGRSLWLKKGLKREQPEKIFVKMNPLKSDSQNGYQEWSFRSVRNAARRLFTIFLQNGKRKPFVQANAGNMSGINNDTSAGPCADQNRKRAKNVESFSLLRVSDLNIANNLANEWQSTGVSEKKEPVYNLSVEGTHEFFANGILVHNCDFLGHVGMNLGMQVAASSGVEKPDEPLFPKAHTGAWLKWMWDYNNRAAKSLSKDGF